MTPEPSKVRRVIDLFVQIQLGTAGDQELAEIDELLRASEALRVLYLDLIHVASIAGDGIDRLDESTELGRLQQTEIDREVLAELLEEALRNRRLSDIRDKARSQLLADRALARVQAAVPAEPERDDNGPRVLVIPRSLVYGLAAASILLICSLFFLSRTDEPDAPDIVEQPAPAPVVQPPAVVAEVLDRYNDRWGVSINKYATSLLAGDYRLEAGFVRVRLNDGAEVLIQGPAHFQLQTNNSIGLDTGKLVAEVPPSATGFTINTPDARIVDIGTEFGVTAERETGRGSASTRLQVYQGEVRAAAKTNGAVVGEFMPLFEEQAIEIDSGKPPRRIEFNPDLHERDLYQVKLRPTLSQSAVWLRERPANIRLDGSPADHLQVFIERSNVLLKEDLPVDFNRQQSWPHSGTGKYQVRSGQRVDVYYLNLDSFGKSRLDIRTTIDFGRPILGVIAAGETLEQTDPLFASPDTKYPTSSYREGSNDSLPRGLDVLNDDDWAWVERDGQTLRLDIGTEHYVDQVRVLVEAIPVKAEDRGPKPE